MRPPPPARVRSRRLAFPGPAVSALVLATMLALIGWNPSPRVAAHPGGLDASGCHTCRTNCEASGLVANEYHCGHGASAPAPAVAAGEPPEEGVGEVAAPRASDPEPTTRMANDAEAAQLAGANYRLRLFDPDAADNGDSQLVSGLRAAAVGAWIALGLAALAVAFRKARIGRWLSP
ncbi:MAG TPA: hypothetical protein VNL92_06720 [Dehalococcoidia bacterium]|nr:hypothetical protein [Dehalococcoidia bacterium]